MILSQDKKQGFKKHFVFILVHVSLSLTAPPAFWYWELTCSQQQDQQLLYHTSETHKAKRCCSATGENVCMTLLGQTSFHL